MTGHIEELVPGVFVRTAEREMTNTTIVDLEDGRVLLVDPAVEPPKSSVEGGGRPGSGRDGSGHSVGGFPARQGCGLCLVFSRPPSSWLVPRSLRDRLAPVVGRHLLERGAKEGLTLPDRKIRSPLRRQHPRS